MDFNKPSHLDAALKTPRQPIDLRPAEVSAHHKKPRSGKRWLKGALFVLIIIAGLTSAWSLRCYLAYQGIDRARYQAVYLDNDNVYFGKVQYQIDGDILLSDVFRVQAEKDSSSQSSSASNSSAAQQTASNIRLIKPGKEVHAPDDTMLINKGKVLFIENLKTDGEVAKVIANYHKENDSTK
jgi:hypothetical protein